MVISPIVCALLLGSPSLTGQGSVTLKFHPPVGQTYHYRMTMAMVMPKTASTPQMDMNTDIDLNMKVLSRSGEMTTIESRILKAKVSVPSGSPMAAQQAAIEKAMAGKVVSSTFNSHYQIQSVNGSGMDSMFSNFQSLAFPTHSIRVGESWASTMDLGKLLGAALGSRASSMKINGKIPLKFKLLRISQRGSMRLAEVSISMDGSANVPMGANSMSMQISGAGTFSIDLATGMTVQTKVDSVNRMTIGKVNVVQKMSQMLAMK